MNSEVLTRRRLIRYLSPVLVLSIIYNINRFFEAEVKWEEECIANTTTCSSVPYISVTEIRKSSDAYNLSILSIRCLVLGLFPLMILGFLNTKIYKDVQERRARNVPLGSSQLSDREVSLRIGGEGRRPKSAPPTTKSINFSFSRSFRKKRSTGRIKGNGPTFYNHVQRVSSTPSRTGVRATIEMEELIPLRYRIMKNNTKHFIRPFLYFVAGPCIVARFLNISEK